MTSHKFNGRVLMVLLTMVLLGMPSQGLKLQLAASSTDEYIEVHGTGIAFVPLSTKCVKYRGEIKSPREANRIVQLRGRRLRIAEEDVTSYGV